MGHRLPFRDALMLGDREGEEALTSVGMRACPRCGRPLRRRFLLGIDLTGRTFFALAWTVVILAYDLLIIFHNWNRPEARSAEAAWMAVLLVSVNFLFAFLFGWPRYLHSGHRRPAGWRGSVESLAWVGMVFGNYWLMTRVFHFLHGSAR
jgi:hypothetical protein